jgi:hypothetical protein
MPPPVPIKVGKTRTAGSSSGGLAQLCDHPYGPSHEKFINGTITFVDYCRTTHSCTDHLDKAGRGGGQWKGKSFAHQAQLCRGVLATAGLGPDEVLNSSDQPNLTNKPRPTSPQPTPRPSRITS